MADLAIADHLDAVLDDMGYEWRRELLLEDGADAEITAAPG